MFPASLSPPAGSGLSAGPGVDPQRVTDARRLIEIALRLLAALALAWGIWRGFAAVVYPSNVPQTADTRPGWTP